MASAWQTTPAAAAPDRPKPPVDASIDAIPEQAVGTPDADPFWEDLAGNLPGQGLIEQAAVLRAAHPWRCRLARPLNVHTDERAKRVGARGEQLVAIRLAKLPQGWRTLHAIVRSESGTDVDHRRDGGATDAGAPDADLGITLGNIQPGTPGMHDVHDPHLLLLTPAMKRVSVPERAGKIESLTLVLEGNSPRFPWKPSATMLTYRLKGTTEEFGVDRNGHHDPGARPA